MSTVPQTAVVRRRPDPRPFLPWGALGVLGLASVFLFVGPAARAFDADVAATELPVSPVVVVSLLVAAAALLGAGTTWWWVRGRYDDVTEAWGALGARVAELEARPADATRGRTTPDLRETELEVALAAARSRILALEDHISTAPTPHPGAAAMAPRVAELERALADVTARATMLQERIDQSAGHAEATQIEARAARGRAEDLQARLADAHARIDTLQIELGDARLRADGLQAALDQLGDVEPSMAAPPSPAAELASVLAADDGTRRLTHAAFGEPDDLERMKGVGPKLRTALHGIGVFYFWQIAGWSDADVARVDALLEAFRGRIERDAWVAQARTFAAEPGAARPPG